MRNKFTTPYHCQLEPQTIQGKKGSMFTAASYEIVVTINSSFFKEVLAFTYDPSQIQEGLQENELFLNK